MDNFLLTDLQGTKLMKKLGYIPIMANKLYFWTEKVIRNLSVMVSRRNKRYSHEEI